MSKVFSKKYYIVSSLAYIVSFFSQDANNHVFAFCCFSSYYLCSTCMVSFHVWSLIPLLINIFIFTVVINEMKSTVEFWTNAILCFILKHKMTHYLTNNDKVSSMIISFLLNVPYLSYAVLWPVRSIRVFARSAQHNIHCYIYDGMYIENDSIYAQGRWKCLFFESHLYIIRESKYLIIINPCLQNSKVKSWYMIWYATCDMAYVIYDVIYHMLHMMYDACHVIHTLSCNIWHVR